MLNLIYQPEYFHEISWKSCLIGSIALSFVLTAIPLFLGIIANLKDPSTGCIFQVITHITGLGLATILAMVACNFYAESPVGYLAAGIGVLLGHVLGIMLLFLHPDNMETLKGMFQKNK